MGLIATTDEKSPATGNLLYLGLPSAAHLRVQAGAYLRARPGTIPEVASARADRATQPRPDKASSQPNLRVGACSGADPRPA